MTSSSKFARIPGELGALLEQRRSVRAYSSAPVPLTSIKRILFAGQGLTSDDGKRSAPSAHALYPMKLYLLARRVHTLDSGLYTFDPVRSDIVRKASAISVGALVATSLAGDQWLEEAAAVVVIAADQEAAITQFRDQQADGLRGLRYIDFEAGAIAQNMMLTASREQLGSVVVMGVDHDKLHAVLSLPARIQPVALLCLGVEAIANADHHPIINR